MGRCVKYHFSPVHNDVNKKYIDLKKKEEDTFNFLTTELYDDRKNCYVYCN